LNIFPLFKKGHEIAHIVLGHAAEKITYGNLLSMLMIAPILALWTFLPKDITAFLADWIINLISTLLLELPYSRSMEIEADEAGIEIASKACFDIREAPIFWAKMEMLEKLALDAKNDELELPEFLSTHPSYNNRQEYLSDMLPNALEKRARFGCGELKGVDPMEQFLNTKKLLMQIPRK
jgi:Zn-dependent protease with chaperone function